MILTARDPETWLASCVKTVFSSRYIAELSRSPFAGTAQLLSGRFLRTPGLILPESPMRGGGSALAAYQAHNEHVRKIVSPDRLLVYDIKAGWGPLCDFLDLPVPDIGFPHANRNEDFFDVMNPFAAAYVEKA